MRQGGTLTWLLGDHLGSATITATENGTLASEQKYTAWGQTRSGSVGTDRQYTGQISEAQLGLYFYNARFYDPYLARFIQADSIIPQPGSPLAWDRYGYSRNNPITYNDPSGHFPDFVLDIAFIAMDIYFIQTEGWTLNNTAALCADLVLAAIPIGTGGGPAIQAISRGPKAVVAAYAQAAVHIPEWARAGQAGEKLLQSLDGLISFSNTSCPGCGSGNPELLRGKGGIANNQHIKDLSNIGKDGISAWCSTCRAKDLSGKFWGRTAEELKAFANELGLDPNKAVVYTPEFGGAGHYSLFIDAFGKDGKLLPEYADKIDQFLRNGVNRVK